MPRGNGPRRSLRLELLRRWKPTALVVSTLGLCQLPVCFPDLLGALNFELQNLITGVLLNAVNIVIRNLLGL
ncbi:MAG: hypothetical protein O7F76_00200 [Planctomycetota bacterium]|nr:hypothetical protein [Planctomycetota bacterium]MCZ6815099.1 hypothetical protein [Planctomycetota bacterium]